MIKINSDDINLILLGLASMNGPSFSDLCLEFPQTPSSLAIQLTTKIYPTRLKCLGTDPNANLRALGYVVYSYIFNQKTINTFLIALFFQDLLVDCRGLNQIQNCPYLEGLSKENRAKLIATMLIQIIQSMRQQKQIKKLPIITELFGLCARVMLARQNLVEEASNYNHKLQTTQLYHYLFEKLDLDFQEKPKIYFFPEKHLFISSHDDQQYISGNYYDNETDFLLNQKKINDSFENYTEDRNPVPFNSFQLNLNEDVDYETLPHPQQTPYFCQDLPSPKFDIKIPEQQKISINPIIQEDELEDNTSLNSINGVKNSAISPLVDKYSISDFNPHECHSDEQPEQPKRKNQQRPRSKKKLRVQTEESVQNETLASMHIQSQFRFQQIDPKNILSFKRHKKSLSGIINDKDLFIKNKKKLGAYTEGRKMLNIPNFIINKGKKKPSLQMVSNIYQWIVLPEKPICLKKKSYSKSPMPSETRHKNPPKQYSKMPQFLKKRQKKGERKELKSFHSLSKIKQRIIFTYQSPSKGNQQRSRSILKHVRSFSNRPIALGR